MRFVVNDVVEQILAHVIKHFGQCDAPDVVRAGVPATIKLIDIGKNSPTECFMQLLQYKMHGSEG